MAAGTTLNTSVMPFILRGVGLLGITSAGCPTELRHQLWQKLGSEWKPSKLEDIVTNTVTLDTLQPTFRAMLDGKTHGRTLVKIES
jgi:NADPH2:quinone reductase